MTKRRNTETGDTKAYTKERTMCGLHILVHTCILADLYELRQSAWRLYRHGLRTRSFLAERENMQ